jgi:NhaA family Na+:H+ antiporter
MRLAAQPLERFLAIEAASGIVLVVVACAAMAWANSALAPSYFALREVTLGVSLGELTTSRTLEWVVNDILMTIFFFVVGMEIRREIHHGELSEWRRAALPVAAAIGGMAVPAGIYLAVAGEPATASGWGVPMATDIAFALGVLALLGKRVPPALRVLLLALAVIDDLGAILVIALFYSAGIEVLGLVVASLGVGGVLLLQKLGVRSIAAYCMAGAVVWAGAYAAGLHPTIAGVIIGMLTPVQAWLTSDALSHDLLELADDVVMLKSDPDPHALSSTLREIDVARREAVSPAERLIHALHPWVAYGIMPAFALVNAGVTVDVSALDGTAMQAASGVFIALLIGKPLGVVSASLLAVKLNVASLPRGIATRELLVLGLAAGIGFTMALFIAQLAFQDATLLSAAKLGILAASCIAALLAVLAGAWLLRPDAYATHGRSIARTADEAERSTIT